MDDSITLNMAWVKSDVSKNHFTTFG